MRTITEILKDVDKAETTGEVCRLADEIQDNKYKYPLVQLQFSKEHLQNKANEIIKKERALWFEIIKPGPCREDF